MEMYRREQFREDLLSEHARDIANLEARLHELDSMLAAAAAGRRTTASRCECGAPIIWGRTSARTADALSVNRLSSPARSAVIRCRLTPGSARAAANQPSGPPTATASVSLDATVIRPAGVGAEEGRPKPDRWEE